MKTVILLLLATSLYLVDAAPAEEKTVSKRGRGQCLTSMGTFNHGDLVNPRNSRCLKYRCNAGRLEFVRAGCPDEDTGRCRSRGEEWDAKDCHRYRCQGMPYNSYRIVRLRSGCVDARRRCRRPGETFAYYVNDRIYRNCSCTTTPYSIRYACQPQ